MKKWVIGLSILLGISVLGSGAVVGKIYRDEFNVVEQHLEEPLDKVALKNIYITSGVDIRLEPTSGSPFVELDSKVTGLVKEEPMYEIVVRTEGESSYINIEPIYSTDTFSFMRNESSIATIYLPIQDINKLSVKQMDDNVYYYNQSLSYNINDFNVNQLKIDMDFVNIDLRGKYQNIDIDKRYGDISLDSKTPTKVTVNGSNGGAINLEGQYTEVDIQNGSGDVSINSETPIPVNVKSRGGEVKLKGNYKAIDVDNDYGNVFIQSHTPCEVNLFGEGDMQLEGAFKKIDVKAQYGDISIINTIAPERINLFGKYQNVNVTLPKDIPGFEVTYKKNYETQETVYTDFHTNMGTAGQLIDKVQYGDNSSKITIEQTNSQPYILEGNAIAQ